MRKIALLSLMLLLASCAPVPHEKPIQNSRCTDARSATVLRVMDNYVLAWVEQVDDPVSMEIQDYYQPSDNHFVFLLRDPKETYFPRQKLNFEADQCLVYTGSYNYQRNAKQGTYLMGKLIHDRVPDPAYDKWKKQHDKKVKNSCWLQRRKHKKCTNNE